MKNNKEQKREYLKRSSKSQSEEKRERKKASDLQIGRRKPFQKGTFTHASRYDLDFLQTRLRKTT